MSIKIFLVKDDKFTVIGKVLVAKNPCMHSDDVQVFGSCGKSLFGFIYDNVIVFLKKVKFQSQQRVLDKIFILSPGIQP